jgi:hypothetical protein
MTNACWNLLTNIVVLYINAERVLEVGTCEPIVLRAVSCIVIFISRLTTEVATVTYIMAVPPSEVASLVQQAALRINLKHETELEILKKLEAEYINDLWQLHYITAEQWQSMGAPIGFLASVECCFNEAGFSSFDKRQPPARGRSETQKGRNSSQNTSQNAGERHQPLRRRMKKDSSSAASPSSSATKSKAAFRELKETLRQKSKEGRALAVNDSKGNPIYEWEQSSDHVLVYVDWPFPFDYDDPDTKCKCTIASDTIQIKGKRQNDSRSLRYTAGGLVNVLHSKWSVVYKGSGSSKKKIFAIEIALCKKNAGDIWNTALKAKHIGTNHMTAGEIKEELQSYGIEASPRSVSRGKRKPARARSYDMSESLVDDDSSARRSQAKEGGQTNHMTAGEIKEELQSHVIEASPRSVSRGKRKPARARSYDMSESLVDDDSSEPRSQAKKGPARARSYDMSESLVDDDSSTPSSQAKKGVQTSSRFMENQVVYYTSNDGMKEKAKILKIHLDDELVPFYDIRMEDSGKEKQTDDSHVSSLIDDLFKSILTPKGRGRSDSVDTEISEITTDRSTPNVSRNRLTAVKSS